MFLSSSLLSSVHQVIGRARERGREGERECARVCVSGRDTVE